MLPAISTDGKIYMKSKSEISMSPNGNGALLSAVHMNQQVKEYIGSVDYIQIIGVDNVINKVLDPLHLGYTISRGYELAIKTCEKRNAQEKVGVIGRRSGQYSVIEYSELSDELRNATEDDGVSLKFRQGHILVLMLSAARMLELAQKSGELASLYHRAFKKIQHVETESY